MKKLSAFSLMEMMVVLLIVSIVAAASAPMVNKKLLTQASEKSPWVWTGTNNNIAYNLNNAEQTAIIGSVNPPSAASNAKLYIDTKAGSNGVYRPQISFGQDGGKNVMSLFVNKRSIWFTDKAQPIVSTVAHNNSVIMGYGAWGVSSNATAIGANTKFQDNSTAIGYGANASSNGIAIGKVANASQSGSIAIGSGTAGLANVTMDTRASGVNSIAIGRSAFASGKGAISIGGANGLTITTASGDNSVALGYLSTASSQETTALGSNTRTLMPRSIAIGQNAYVGAGNTVQARAIAIGYNAVSNKSDSIAIGGKYGANATRATGTGAIAIGATVEASGYQSIAIGGTAANTINVDTGSASTTRATATNALAVGTQSYVSGTNAVAFGSSTYAAGANTVAIGPSAFASGANSIAIGPNAYSIYSNSVAIGRNASPSTSNQIVLGTSDSTVRVPGNFVVEGNVLLAGNQGSIVYMREEKTKSYLWHFYREKDDKMQISQDSSVTIGGITYSSDRRLKNIGKAFTGGLEQIKKLQVFNYTFKDDKSKTPRVGVMAQDLQKIFPDAVIKGEDGFLRIRMEDMFYALVNSVKELAVKFEAHDKKIEELTKQNLELQKEIAGLEKRITDLEKKINHTEDCGVKARSPQSGNNLKQV